MAEDVAFHTMLVSVFLDAAVNFFDILRCCKQWECKNTNKFCNQYESDYYVWFQLAVNWVTNVKDVGKPVPGRGVKKLSAGTTQHEETSHHARDHIFKFLLLPRMQGVSLGELRSCCISIDNAREYSCTSMLQLKLQNSLYRYYILLL